LLYFINFTLFKKTKIKNHEMEPIGHENNFSNLGYLVNVRQLVVNFITLM